MRYNIKVCGFVNVNDFLRGEGGYGEVEKGSSFISFYIFSVIAHYITSPSPSIYTKTPSLQCIAHYSPPPVPKYSENFPNHN